MTLTARLALIGASVLAAAAIAFALPLPGDLQHPRKAETRPTSGSPSMGVCGCASHDHDVQQV